MTPWRDPSPLYPDVDRSGTAPSPPCAVPVDVGPADVPAAVRIPVPAAATSPHPAGGSVRSADPSATASSRCKAYGCTLPIASRLTRMCDTHGERYLTDLREYTEAIGRGSFTP